VVITDPRRTCDFVHRHHAEQHDTARAQEQQGEQEEQEEQEEEEEEEEEETASGAGGVIDHHGLYVQLPPAAAPPLHAVHRPVRAPDETTS
jgi:hypothetical protein